jgi:hypothetical protein
MTPSYHVCRRGQQRPRRDAFSHLQRLVYGLQLQKRPREDSILIEITMKQLSHVQIRVQPNGQIVFSKPRITDRYSEVGCMSNCIALQLDTPSGQDHDARVGGTIMDVVVWLRSLGLGKYEAAFRENDIDDTVLLTLSAEDLKELGVTSFGHRRKLVDAIAALRADASSKAISTDAASTSTVPSVAHEDRAERRQVTVMFSDLVGSTALSTRMDPEDLRDIISASQRCVAEAIQRFGGFVASTWATVF